MESCIYDYNIIKHSIPIWNRELPSTNIILKLHCFLPFSKKHIFIATSGFFLMTFNGSFLAAGPSRSGHNFGRIDLWPLPISEGLLEILCYYPGVECYQYVLKQPYIQAIVTNLENGILAATGKFGFSYFHELSRIRKAPRYSYQRSFVEMYEEIDAKKIVVHAVNTEHLMKRRSKLPGFDFIAFLSFIKYNVVYKNNGILQFWYTSSPYFKSYSGFNHEMQLVNKLYNRKFFKTIYNANEKIYIKTNQSIFLSLDQVHTGHISISIESHIPTKIAILWDEVLIDNEINWWRIESNQFAYYEFKSKKIHTCYTLEPYSLKYLEIFCISGECTIHQAGMYLHENKELNTLKIQNPQNNLEHVVKASLSTLAQNAVDIFMDCPSRERAGWLCDSFFSARAMYALTGDLNLETDFLENFLSAPAPGNRDYSIPMCYPAEHIDQNYVPQNNLWFILQLADYAKRGGDHILIQLFKYRIDRIFAYLFSFMNKHKLLVDLDGWKFMEWSKVSDFQEGFNFPTNILFSRALIAAGNLYNNNMYITIGVNLLKKSSSLSWDGEKFRDQGIFSNNQIRLPPNSTAYAQYLAKMCDCPQAKNNDAWWNTMIRGGVFSNSIFSDQLYPPNILFGIILRWHLLVYENMNELFHKEFISVCKKMQELTGTLWEHIDTRASCNHGCLGYLGAMVLNPSVASELPGNIVH